VVRQRIVLAAALFAAVACSGALAAEDTPAPATKFETTIDFVLQQQTELDGEIGQVQIRGVEFVESSVKTGAIKGALSSGDDDLASVITTRINCATTSTDKWKLTITVEFLDEDGEVIDRAGDGISVKNEAKIFDFKHTTLKWAVPRIKQARITVAFKS
jgi:hypothetical protein